MLTTWQGSPAGIDLMLELPGLENSPLEKSTTWRYSVFIKRIMHVNFDMMTAT